MLAEPETKRRKGIRLAPGAATALSMAGHELATNAAKYGALSSCSGKLSIHWDIATAPGEGQTFALTWTETGGPEVQPPIRRGFGMQAIEKLLAQEIEGRAVVAFAPEGLRCSIEAPFTRKSARVFDGSIWNRCRPTESRWFPDPLKARSATPQYPSQIVGTDSRRYS